MVILLGYPFLMKKFYKAPESAPYTAVQNPETPASEIAATQYPDKTIKAATQEVPLSAPSFIRYENNSFEVLFSSMGGTIKKLYFKGEKNLHHSSGMMFYEDLAPQTPGIFGTEIFSDSQEISGIIFQSQTFPKGVKFSWEKAGDYTIIKTYTFERNKPVINLEVEIQNKSGRARNFPLQTLLGMDYQGHGKMEEQQYEAVASTDKVESSDLNKILKKGFHVEKSMGWIGLTRKYFAILAKTDSKIIRYYANGNEKSIFGKATLEPISVNAEDSLKHQFFIYAGPQRYETLKSFNMGFEDLLSKGFFGLFKIWLLLALKFFYQFVHNYGWAIILLTLALKIAFAPFTHMSFKSMKKMQALQPKVKSIQERFKNDSMKMNQEMMALYKRNRVNPMAGCLPMLMQIPVFMAFYQVLNSAIELKNAPFINWVTDLSEPDHFIYFPFSIPFIGDSLHLLPLLMIGSMVWQQKLTPQTGVTPEQTKIFALMPLFFGFLFYKMPSGLVLYWLMNNLFSIVQQIFVNRIVVALHHEDQD